MKNSKETHLEITESQLLIIRDRIKSWSTKEQVIDIMRCKYGRPEDQVA